MCRATDPKSLECTCGCESKTSTESIFPLHNVLVVPSLLHNLLSVHQFTRDNNCSIEFDALGFSVKDIPTRRMMLRCNSAGDLYTIPVAPPAPHASIAISTNLWHHCLGHPSSATINILRHSASISCNKVEHTLCHSCQLGKHVQLPFSNSSSFSSMPFELVHCDVWTSPVASILGFQYYLILLDDFTHFCWTFPLVRKSEVAAHITNFCNYVSTQFSIAIKAI